MKYYVSNVNVISEDIYDVDDFWINVQVDISEKGGAGAEVFSTDLTSPTRISKVCETETLLGHGLIISTSMDLSSKNKHDDASDSMARWLLTSS